MRLRHVVCVVLLLSLSFSFTTCDASPSDDIIMSIDGDTINVHASGQTYFSIHLNNISNSDYILTPIIDGIDDVSFTYNVDGKQSSFDGSTFLLNNHTDNVVFITISVEKYVKPGDYSFTLGFVPFTPDDIVGQSPLSQNFTLKISPMYDGHDRYNTIVGIISNPFPEPFDSPLFAGFISFLIWIIASILVAFVAVRISIMAIIKTKEDSESSSANLKKLKGLWKYVFAIMIVIGISDCLNIIGANEHVVVIFGDISRVLFSILGAFVVWSLYRAMVVELGSIKKEDERTGLVPLALMLGKIIIFFGGAIAVLTVYGIDLVSLLMSLGLIATAISIGASNIISQFLSGLVILISRPFTVGDKVTIGTDRQVLIVEKIKIMSTVFKSWSNEEYYTIPNSVIVNSKAVNITRDNVNYRVYDYYSIAHSSDITKAKEIMFECALDHPEVVTDGSFGIPDVKFYSVDSDCITLRLSFVVSDHENYGTWAAQIRKNIFDKFGEENIEIPYSQYTVNIDSPVLVKTNNSNPDGNQL